MAKLPTLVGRETVQRVVHLGEGRVTLVLKDGSTVTGLLKQSPRRVPSPTTQSDERVVA